MKILQIRSEFRDNGPGTQALTIGKELRRRGHNVYFAASGGVLAPTIVDEGFEFFAIDTLAVDRRSPLDSARSISALVKLIRSQRFDVIHAHNAATSVLSAVAARLAGVKVVSVQSVRGIELRKNYQWRNWIYRVNPAHLFAVSSFTRNELVKLGVKPDQVTVSYNGIDLGRFDPDTIDGISIRNELSLGDGPVIGHVGKFSGAKGQQVLVEALPFVKEHFPEAKAVFVGDGPTLDEVQRLSQDLGVSEMTRFVGFSLEIPKFQAAFDLYTQPSTWGEMLPNAIIEAMAMRNPWVGSDISGLSELTDNGKAGLVVEPGNAQYLADAIVRLLRNQAELKRMGYRAREYVERKFTIANVTDTIESVYARSMA